jgi:putative colanic acid biosynthesis UDP-glucose lipid carrier transferase
MGDATIIELQRAPLKTFQLLIKRMIDILLAGTASMMLIPLLALVAIAIKLDSSGPAIFRQTRLGLNGKPFQILKFRTMTVLENGESVKQAERFDKRVTRLGSWLRCTSIDELPQLINVLKGEMSIVGPRPHAVAHDNHSTSSSQTTRFDNASNRASPDSRRSVGLAGRRRRSTPCSDA